MATKLQYYSALAEQTLSDLTAKRGNWMQFLDTAAWLYKYPFQDQLMIYAQRPDATACAELELWNEQFNRWVRRGSKGIALIDDSGSYPRLKYVFDVSDTEPSLYRSKPVHLWELRQEHKIPLLSELAKNYEDISADDSLAEAFRSIAGQLAKEYYEDNYREILFRSENSALEPDAHYDFAGTMLEDTDDTALRAAFEQALANSVTYTIMARCGLDPAGYFDDEDFQSVTDFNTPDMINALGVASSSLSEQVLRDIYITIRKYERVKNAERSENNHEQSADLHRGRGLSAARPEAERTAEGADRAAGQIRPDEKSLPQGAQADHLQPPAAEREAVPASAGGGRSGDSEVDAGDGSTDGEELPFRQSDRPDGVDGGDERPESAGRGNGAERADLQLNESVPSIEPETSPEQELSGLGGVFPADTSAPAAELPDIPETFSQVGKSSIEEILSASSISLDEVDSILRDGGNERGSVLRIAAHFAKGRDDNTDFLGHEYLYGRWGRSPEESGKGFDFGNHRISTWFDENGINLAVGASARGNLRRLMIPWEQAAARINELMLGGNYVSGDTFHEALDNERQELAGFLWDFYRDDMGAMPEEWRAEKGGYPEDKAIIRSLLDDTEERQFILDRLEADVANFDDTEHRRAWHNRGLLLSNMRDAMLSPVIFPNDNFSPTKNFSYFITEDELDAALTRGSSFSEGKFRILSYFLSDHSDKEKMDFLKNEYGHGGGTWSATNGWLNAEPGKGFTLSRGGIGNPDAEVNLKWNAMAKRIQRLISDGLYMTRAEFDRTSNYERIMLVRRVNNSYYNMPDEYERPFGSDLDFHYPHEAEWEAIRIFLEDDERVDGVLSQMRYIFENTSTEDRYYDTRKAGFEALTAFREGTYTLFPGIEHLPAPETAAARRRVIPEAPRREMIEDMRESGSGGFSFDHSAPVEQLSLFDFGLQAELPSAAEQREKIDQKLRQEAKQEAIEAEAGTQAPAHSLPEDADAPLLNISDADKARIAEQFTENPRSREAVNLVREIYGDRLGMPLPQAIKRIAELVAEGKFAAAVRTAAVDEQSPKLMVLQEIQRIKAENGGAIVMWRMVGFFEMYGADAELAANVLNIDLIPDPSGQRTGIPRHSLGDHLRKLNEAGYAVAVASVGTNDERNITLYNAKPPIENIPYHVGDRLMYNGKLHEIEQISDFVKLHNLDTPSSYPIFDYVSVRKYDFERMLSDGGIAIEPPAVTEPGTPEPAPELDFDAAAQTILGRVLADSDYAEALANAKSRTSLRNPCGWALEQTIRDHETDEPQVYHRYFYDEEFNDNLFDFVLKQSWEQRPQPVSEAPSQAQREGFIEITDPAELAEIDVIFGEDKPKSSYIEGSHIVLDLREKLSGKVLPDAPFVAGEFVIDNITGNYITVSATYDSRGESARFSTILTSDEVEQYTVKPVAEKLYEELSPSGKDTTAYYLFQYPDGIHAGVALSHDTLALIKDRADTYVICAEACHLSAEEMGQWSIGFRKMPRDWNLLPEAVQEQMRLHRPEYEQQWQELYGEAEQASTPAVPVTPTLPAVNFHITYDHLGEGGAKTKFRNNINALHTLKDIEFDGRTATPQEQEILSRYVGWGGIQQAFDPDNKDWEDEYLELNALLTPEEWDSARASVLNAHYTSPLVIKVIYETVERLGFKSGNILEPSCGIGHFFGLLPDSMQDSRLYGVELDSVTARIAKQLYPNADIQQTGYEKTQFSDAFFDIAIGNVPFGGYGVLDKRYKTNFLIHDYFFQKTLDKVRPGGIIAFITSKGTLDKQNPEVRKYIAQRAELLGAVRLPNNAFLKNAGTESTTDIIFLQKRDRPLDITPEWVHLGLTEDGLPLNRYFLDNPEMLLGKMTNGTGTRMYGSENSTTCVPIKGADLAQQLKTALSYIQEQYTLEELDDLDGVDDHAIPADPNVKNFSYTIVPGSDEDLGSGTVYFRENSLMYPVDLPAATLGRIRGMIGLRDCVQKLIALQLDEYSEEEIKAQQAELNTLYDSFIAEFGLISGQTNSRAFNADSSYYLLSSLEILDEDGELARKADMFTKRTIKQRTVITHVDTASEALAVSLGEKARIDMAYMSELTGRDEAALFEELRGVIFLDYHFNGDLDSYTYRTADDFLSGNVREKLKKYQEAVDVVPDDYRHLAAFRDNVAALTAIQPKDLEAGEIAVRLGATWIDPQYVQQFMYELLNTSNYNKKLYQVQYHTYTGEWQVTGKGRAQYSDINATVTYGTSRMNAYQILDDTLNLRDVRVYDYVEDADGREKRVLNKKETMLAQQKQEQIKQKFKDWLWQDPERRQTLVRQYNDLFNSVRPREYDGSHITFSGINPEIRLSKHQKDGAARQLFGGNTLYAHVVGAGKTFTMIAAAQESKRLSLCRKSLFAVPNHLTEQWAAEYLRLYPAANILVATKKDFEMRNRRKFCAKIATGDYDAVIIGHSQLEKIPMSRERQERLLHEQIWEIEEGVRELKSSNGERFSIKQLEKTKKSLELRLTKLLDGKQRDDVVTFEQLGVDRLFVDEAHQFKNLFLYTKMRNVAGLSTSEAQKSSDLFMKCRYMDEFTGNKGVIFATGTPISNSMSEMYTMQRYLQYDTLMAKNLTHFDAWASIFGEIVTSIELAPEGTGYRARTRFSRFHNLPELMTLFKDVADIQTADMLNLPVPEAKFENIIVEPSELQKEMVQELSERAAAVHARLVEPNVDNMLKITTDGRKIGLDQRLINPLLPDFEGSKVNACTDKVFEIWRDTRTDRLTQLVFCDFSTPNKDGRFNVYDDIRAKLLERGIPESEVAFIHDANTETKKKELFAKVRQGKVRILFGSTFKMGAGTNVQDRLVAIHDADCPWRPADLEQRSGRIIRQGNQNDQVQIYRYATSGTFDSYLWQTVQKKQEFIAQIMSSKSPVRSCEDVDETALSYAEIKALCAGNPLIAEKMNLDNEVAKLRMLKSEHQSQHYRLEDGLLKQFPEQITSVKERIAGIEKDIAIYTAQKGKCVEVQTGDTGSALVSAQFPGMTVDGTAYSEKEPAAKALLEACKGVKGRNTDVFIGEYMDFKMSLRYESFGSQINLLLRGAMTYQIELGTDALGNLTRLSHALDKLPERLEGAQLQLDNLNKQVEAAKLELAKPFEQEPELQEKEARLALLNADLNIDGDGGLDVVNDTENRNAPGNDFSDEPEDDSYDEDRPDITRSGIHFGYNREPDREAASAKAKPSILDGIRSFDSGRQNGVPSSNRPAERGI